jgi:hypothetical protein
MQIDMSGFTKPPDLRGQLERQAELAKVGQRSLPLFFPKIKKLCGDWKTKMRGLVPPRPSRTRPARRRESVCVLRCDAMLCLSLPAPGWCQIAYMDPILAVINRRFDVAKITCVKSGVRWFGDPAR